MAYQRAATCSTLTRARASNRPQALRMVMDGGGAGSSCSMHTRRLTNCAPNSERATSFVSMSARVMAGFVTIHSRCSAVVSAKRNFA